MNVAPYAKVHAKAPKIHVMVYEVMMTSFALGVDVTSSWECVGMQELHHTEFPTMKPLD